MRVARVLLVIAALTATSLGVGLAAARPAAAASPAADGGISATISDGAYTFAYTMTGVTAGAGDAPKSRLGTVTGTTVTLSGTAHAGSPMPRWCRIMAGISR